MLSARQASACIASAVSPVFRLVADVAGGAKQACMSPAEERAAAVAAEKAAELEVGLTKDTLSELKKQQGKTKRSFAEIRSIDKGSGSST